MKITLITLIGTYIYIAATWTMYLAVMNLRRNRDRDPSVITPAVKFFGYPMLIIGLIMDVLLNWTLGTILFIQIPKEFTFSERLGRNLTCDGWRYEAALWFCSNLLDPFDPRTKHCKGKCEIK